MLIVSQCGGFAVNFDNIASVSAKLNKIDITRVGDDYPMTIGEYKSRERASEVFESLLEEIAKRVTAYEMPKK